MNALSKARPERGRARGVTLIEVMIVVVILGLIASAVAIAVFPSHLNAQKRMTRINAGVLRGAASGWRSEHGGEECPTPERLRDDRVIDLGSKLTDAWGTPFRIVCHEGETVVVSLGPDKKESDDDIVEPEAVAMQE